MRTNLPLKSCERVSIPISYIIEKKSHYQRIEDYEFTYNGKLYDIIKELKTADSIVFYCVNDKQEERLLEKFIDSMNTTKSKINGNLKNLLKTLNINIPVRDIYTLAGLFFSYHHFGEPDDSYISAIADVISPPPWL